MSYADEDILKTKLQLQKKEEEARKEDSVKKETEELITDGIVHIYGEEVEFERKTLEDLKISLILPKDYDLVDEEMKAVLYPMGNVPTHVFACGTVQGSVALNKTDNPVDNAHIKDFLPKVKKLMEQVGPQTLMLSSKTIEIDEHNIGILQFVSHAIDMNVYNMMAFLSIDSKLLIMSISFPNKMSDRYISIGSQVIDSLEFLEEEE